MYVCEYATFRTCGDSHNEDQQQTNPLLVATTQIYTKALMFFLNKYTKK